MRLDEAMASRLGSLSAAKLADAMDGGGVVSAEIAPRVPVSTIAGLANTVSPEAGENLGLHLAVAEAPAGSMLLAACPEPADRGIWGALTSTAALRARLVGLATNGLVRDRCRLTAFVARRRQIPPANTGKPSSM